MVHRTMGLPHKSEPKNSYCVIWDKNNRKSQYEWSPTQTTSKKEEI